MDADLSGRLWRLLLMLPVFLFSLTVHEFAHAWMAKRFGDPTAEQEGRLTFDPLAHIDPFGLVMFILSAFAGIGFGWAKPVPVRLGNCREPLKAMFWVAAAGPLSNLLQALVAFVLLVLLGFAGASVVAAPADGMERLLSAHGLSLLDILASVVGGYLRINVALALFNLIPIPPLDGGRILVSILPHRAARFVASLEQYGFIILLVALRPLGWVLARPLFYLLFAVVTALHGFGFH